MLWPFGTATVTLRVPLLRRTSLWAPGVQSLKVPTAEIGLPRILSGNTNWILVLVPFGVMRRAICGVVPFVSGLDWFADDRRRAPNGVRLDTRR
jgi:hypothetical protein